MARPIPLYVVEKDQQCLGVRTGREVAVSRIDERIVAQMGGEAMDDFPARGSRRYRAALGFWAAFTLFFIGAAVYALVTRGGNPPWLALIGGALSLIGIWRFIAEHRRSRSSKVEHEGMG
jgi:hypothetical protein